MKTRILNLLQFGNTLFPLFLYAVFKELFLHLEVGMRFKALHNDSNTKCCVGEIHHSWKLLLIYIVIEWKSIHY